MLNKRSIELNLAKFGMIRVKHPSRLTFTPFSLRPTAVRHFVEKLKLEKCV